MGHVRRQLRPDGGLRPHDGLANLLEYGLGLIPTHGGSLQPPQPAFGIDAFYGRFMVISFMQPEEVTGITHDADWTPTMAAGSWVPVPDTGSGGFHVFFVPLGAEPKGFMRLKVTSP